MRCWRTNMNSPASNLALAKLREKRAAGIGAQGIPARTGTGPFPATPAQRGIWLHEQLAANDALYHVPLGIRIAGELDVDALHTAASAVVAEQHALRTVFTEAAGLRGEVVDDVEIDWETHDLRLVPEAVRPQALDELLTTVSTARFDLVGGRPVRWALIRLGATDWLLAVVAHHLVLDGLSIPVLIEQLWSAYGGLRSVAMPTLTPVRQYADFAEWIDRQPPRTAAIERRAGLVRGVPPLDLSVGRPRPPRVGNDGAKVQLPVPPETTDAVREAAAAHGVPPFVFLLACYQLALAAHTGRDDFAVGIPMAARPHDELARTIGHFVNTVPVRSVLATGQSFAELLRATRDSALAAYEDETVPFERIVETLGGPWDPRYSPVFQVLFVQQRLERPDLSSLGLSVDWHPIDTGATLYDLVLHVAEAGDDLVCETTFNTAILDEPTARRLTGDLITLAATAAADPTITVADLLRTTPHHHLLIQVATPDAEELTAGLAEALYRGGIPARVVAESADASASEGSPGDSGVLLAGIRSAAGGPGQKHAGITEVEHAGITEVEHAGIMEVKHAGITEVKHAGITEVQGRSDLVVVGAGFAEGDEGAAVGLAEACTRDGVGLVVLVPKGFEVAPVLAAQGVIVEGTGIRTGSGGGSGGGCCRGPGRVVRRSWLLRWRRGWRSGRSWRFRRSRNALWRRGRRLSGSRRPVGPWRLGWRSCGLGRSRCLWSGGMMISSCWVVPRWGLLGCCRRCSTSSVSPCRCGSCSSGPPLPRRRCWWNRRRRSGIRVRRWFRWHAPTVSCCRCRMPRSGCGSWRRWIRGTAPTSCRVGCGCAGRSMPVRWRWRWRWWSGGTRCCARSTAPPMTGSCVRSCGRTSCARCRTPICPTWPRPTGNGPRTSSPQRCTPRRSIWPRGRCGATTWSRPGPTSTC
ncbi:hypothetical protein F6W96_07405 [Nocardia terpenica]|uniref:Condensation domain-containing protein n=1 Tax=Nocardia terpenica TaxID=455432 RepID=A0A6G9YY75_9NOCA|nr:hypothetical protein F6W96_07405 [Nocardia terpenica]